ncbi:MAG: membrane protein insertase YidC [Crocinitomicaceae bacterium]|nr:membrane protein insertase YidC [Crocinitomicaceae bacterium]
MDKKTLTGLVLIVVILVVFSILNPRNQEAENNETVENDTTQVEDPVVHSNDTSHLVAQLDENGELIIDPEKGQLFTDTTTGRDTFILQQEEIVEELQLPADPDSADTINQSNLTQTDSIEEKIYTLENEKLILEFTNKGGRIKNVYLKDFLTYEDYVNENNEPLQLYDDKSTFGLLYQDGNENVRTDGLHFKVVEQSDKSITLESNNNGKKVGFTYTLKPDKYDLDYNVYFKGFSDAEAQNTKFIADMYLLSTEKYYPNEERMATVYWQYEGDGYDYITREDEELEEETEWMCFRSTFFSAILSNKNGFGTKDSKLGLYEMEDEEQTKYIKKYTADLDLGATNATNEVEMNWYFGPVDYDVLVEYNNGTEDIVELGTGLFRWINKYLIRPLFMFLINSGMSIALAILLLTILVKLVLSPVNYKMYKSSAMMKVLKPEIEKIGKKYPKKEDAMKKQQETMALYRETGVSPLAGCIPMLIQMPILFAIFRLFPSAIELRQKSFLWAEDLSTYDSPIVFGFEIPLYGDHISILTLLMAGTTLIYTHYNSSNMQQPTQEGMPNLKYIMYFFPIMMIFFFNSYASGLSFYYFISTLMTIGIMFAIKRFFIDDEKILAKIEANRANPKKKGKSKFQQRLEEAQRLQQDRSKHKRKK